MTGDKAAARSAYKIAYRITKLGRLSFAILDGKVLTEQREDGTYLFVPKRNKNQFNDWLPVDDKLVRQYQDRLPAEFNGGYTNEVGGSSTTITNGLGNSLQDEQQANGGES